MQIHTTQSKLFDMYNSSTITKQNNSSITKQQYCKLVISYDHPKKLILQASWLLASTSVATVVLAIAAPIVPPQIWFHHSYSPLMPRLEKKCVTIIFSAQRGFVPVFWVRLN